MGALRSRVGTRSLALALALATSTPLIAAADPVDRWRAEIQDASARFGIPVLWIQRVMRAESGGRIELDGKPIASRAGAMGLMQLMPATWASMRAIHGLGPNPHQPRDNILAGTAYLRLMYDRFGYPGLFAAYNAGPGRYANHLASGRALPSETEAYLRKVTRIGIDTGGAVSSRTIEPKVTRLGRDGLFAALRDPSNAPSAAPGASLAEPRPEPLFAISAVRP